MKKRISFSTLHPYIEKKMVKVLEPNQGYKFFDGVEAVNNSDMTVYLVFLSEFDVDRDS